MQSSDDKSHANIKAAGHHSSNSVSGDSLQSSERSIDNVDDSECNSDEDCTRSGDSDSERSSNEDYTRSDDSSDWREPV